MQDTFNMKEIMINKFKQPNSKLPYYSGPPIKRCLFSGKLTRSCAAELGLDSLGSWKDITDNAYFIMDLKHSNK